MPERASRLQMATLHQHTVDGGSMTHQTDGFSSQSPDPSKPATFTLRVKKVFWPSHHSRRTTSKKWRLCGGRGFKDHASVFREILKRIFSFRLLQSPCCAVNPAEGAAAAGVACWSLESDICWGGAEEEEEEDEEEVEELLLKLIVDHLAEFTAEPGVFTMFSEQLKKTYFNILIKPERLGKDVRLLILEHCRWSVIQKYQAVMKGLTVDDLLTFVSGMKAELYTEGLVQGNFTSAESKEFLQYFIDKLQFQPLSAEVPVLFRVVELPQTHHLCKVKSLNKGDANSEVTVYYQSGLKNLREHALMELMVMHMEEPCFDFLRTKETLGYQVYPTCRNTSGVLGFSVTVETQATKFSTEFVEAKIEEFLVSFGERLASLSEEAFKTQVTALIKLKECEDAHLGEEVDRNWFEVVTQQYVFKRLNKEIEALKLFSQEELVSWFLEHRNTSSRKLSVHVVGFGVEENDPPEQSTSCGSDSSGKPPSSSYGEVSELTFLPASSPSLQDVTLISDIRAFTSSLCLHPYHKILS
ncbi:Nardilysin [Larimichthys crocea]|uniref:Uncharacterized protein n=1 Tax=Larimichthys crocea TaxID=215358 RepID=A0ACD3RLG0_LARCR|nr:Nardilysin [Larimichthys crocea]